MSNYVLGLGGSCCDSCAPDDACKAKPVITSGATWTTGVVGMAYSFFVTATNSPTSFTLVISVGAMPAGLTFNTSTGEISGTPTQSGALIGTVYASNACGEGSQAVTFGVSLCGLAISGGDSGYDQTFDVTADTLAYSGFTFSWDMQTVKDRLIVTGPAGCAMLDTGCVSGTGTAFASFCGAGSPYNVRIQLVPDCDAVGTTIWNFAISC